MSFGGYWSAKLAITEHARVKAASAQSPAVHKAFQADFVEKKLLGNREHLFEHAPALISVFEGTASVEDLKIAFPPSTTETLARSDVFKVLIPWIVRQANAQTCKTASVASVASG